MRRDLFGPLERRVERPRPTHCHVRRCLIRTPNIIELQLFLDGNIDALNSCHLVRGTDDGAFRARAIVTTDVNDERVVEFAHVLDSLDHTADLMVGVCRICREYIRLADEKFLLVIRKCVPFLKLGATKCSLAIRPRRELGTRGDDAEPFLVSENRLTKMFPSLVEQMHVADLLDPLRGGLVWRMRSAGDVINKKRLVRRGV